jgi:HSP20 family protein
VSQWLKQFLVSEGVLDMPEVAVTKQKTAASAPVRSRELVHPMFPFGRFFGLSPFELMREFTEEMDQMFRGVGPSTELQAWCPTTDVQRCNGSLVITAELPGLTKDDVKVEVAEDMVIVQGERRQEHKEDHEGYHRWERNYGRFYRAVPLPEAAKTEQVKAELKDGVLKVSVPVPEQAKKTKVVPISA